MMRSESTNAPKDTPMPIQSKPAAQTAQAPTAFAISASSEYHRVSGGCPKGYTQQCGIAYRT
jgi:hypothetical protein